jgi:hypothetical protein
MPPNHRTCDGLSGALRQNVTTTWNQFQEAPEAVAYGNPASRDVEHDRL